MEKYFDNIKVTDVLLKWKTHIIVITILAGIVGGAISYLVKPKYESMAIVYPVNVFPHSNESETEQILQVFQSNDVRNTVAEKQELYKHYKISLNDPLAHAYFADKWDENVSIFRTPNDAVKIRVLDVDPKKACDIANSIIDEYNLFTRALHKKTFSEVIALMDRQRARKFVMLDSLKKEIKRYNEMGIYDVPFQAKELSKALLSGGGNSERIAELQKTFNEHSGDYLILSAWMEGEVGALPDFLQKYDIAYTEFDREFTHAAVVSSPEVAQRRYSPVRWAYVALFMLGGFLMSAITISFLEASRKKKNSATH